MIPILPMRLRFSADRPLQLPPYPGSIWRSAFGKALRDLTCITGASSCEGCPALSGCGYAILFEPPLQAARAGGLTRRYTELPQPYVLSPVLTQSEDKNEAHLDLTLIGQAGRRWKEVLTAAGSVRLGRVKLQLQDVQPLPVNSTDHSLGVAEIPHPPPAPATVRLHLLHPLRLRRQNRYMGSAEFDFAMFFTTLMRRISLLHDQQGGEPLASDYRRLAEQAKSIQVMDSRLEWRDHMRYSARQERRIPLGGVVGAVVLKGDLAELWPWLWTGQWLHVGKSAVMGLGRYQLELLP